jgi:O-antigen/teichoic acid export membrane protein
MVGARDSFLRLFAATLVRHTSIYTFGGFLLLALSMVQALVLVHLLSPSGYGQASVIQVVSTFVALASVSLFRRGALNRTYGAGSGSGEDDDDDGDDDDDEVASSRTTQSRDARESLGTGMLLMVLFGAVPAAALVVGGGGLASVLGLPAGVGRQWLLLGSVSGTIMGLWDLLLSVPHRERRPPVFVGMTATRSIAGFGFVIGFVAVGGGAESAIVGQLVGAAAAVMIALIVLHRSWRVAFKPAEVRPIVTLSLQRAPRTISKWLIHRVPFLVLASSAPSATVGYYRLGTRLTMPVSAPAGAFFAAWLPLERSPALLASRRSRGRQQVAALATTYLTFLVVGLLVVLLVGIDALEDILPESYAPTIALLPWLLLPAVAVTIEQAGHRFGRFRARPKVYVLSLVAGAALCVPASLLLVHALGARGAALAEAIALLFVGAIQWVKSQWGPARIPLQWGRMGAAVALGAACLVIAYGLGAVWPSAGVALDVVALGLYPIGLFALRIVPKSQRQSLAHLRSRVVSRRVDEAVQVTIRHLDRDHREALRAVLANGSRRAPTTAAAQPADKVQLVALEALRRCSGTRIRPQPVELALARYIFSTGPFAERNHALHQLYRARIKPEEIVVLERWRDDARRAISA